MKINPVTIPKVIDTTRKGIAKLTNPSSLLPVILLESTVTGGRTYHAYKRGGKVEMRERFTEEAVSAVFWLGGATALNKLGDKLGERFLHLPKDFDGGFDALRTPLKNTSETLLNKAGEVITPDKINALEKKLAGFKFGKIILSTLIATGFVGFVVPKINQKLTRMMVAKQKEQQPQNTQTPSNQQSSKPADTAGANGDTMFKVSMTDFKNSTDKTAKSPSFGANSIQMANFAHNLENHAIYKLAGTDTGILTGRAANARNKDERIEIIFRDATSSYFYTINPMVVNKILRNTVPNGKLAEIDPKSSQTLISELSRVIKDNGGSIPANEFKSVVLGTIDEAQKATIDSLPFKNDVISLDELKKVVKDTSILEKAEEMSGLQPIHGDLGKVLTRKQVEDVFANGAITDFESMLRINNAEFGAKLTNPEKFVPMKKINKFRDSITTFVDETVKCAKEGQVTEKVLKTVDKKNLVRNGAFWLAGFGVSALFLSTIIPKAQYMITKARTGKNDFPGLNDKKSK